MRNRTGIVVLIAAVLIVVGGFAWWLLRPQPAAESDGRLTAVSVSLPQPSDLALPQPSGAASGGATDVAPSVRAAVVTDAVASRTVRVTGTVMPQRSVTLVSKVPGTVQWVAGGMGHRVGAGDPVVRLDDTELSLALAQAEAQLDAARAQQARLEAGASAEEIAQVQAAVRQAELSVQRLADVLARQEQLFAQGIIPEETLRNVRTEYEVALWQLESARQQLLRVERGATDEERRAAAAQVRQAEVAVRLAQQQLADAVIRAPFAGLLAAQPVEAGTLIGAGTPVAAVVDIDQVIVEAGVGERDVNQLAVGQPVRVYVDALGGGAVAGVVDAVAPVADQQTRNFTVRFRVDNPDHRLKPGMVARVEVDLEGVPVGAAVPQSAVVQRSGRSVVYVLEPVGDGRFVARERAVTAGTPTAGRVALTGVNVGEWVALAPEALRDGMIVNLVELDGAAVIGGGM